MTNYLPPQNPAQNASNVSTSIQREGKMFVQLWDGTNKILFNSDNSANIRITDGNAGRIAGIDSVTYALLTVSYAHHEVHAGSSYFANYSQTLGNADTLGIGLTTPDTTKWLHLAVHAVATANATLNVYEDCTTLTGGVSGALYNQNRNLSNNSGATELSGGTGSNPITRTGGVQIYSAGLANGSPIDWNREAGEEMVLKQNSIYYFEIVNGVNSNIASITLRWYEHTNKE